MKMHFRGKAHPQELQALASFRWLLDRVPFSWFVVTLKVIGVASQSDRSDYREPELQDDCDGSPHILARIIQFRPPFYIFRINPLAPGVVGR